VHVVSERLHARGKLFGVRLDVSIGCSVSLPAIVHVEVAVASIPQAGAHQTTGDLPQHCLVNVAAELVPGTPAHRRSLAYAIEKACDSQGVPQPQGCGSHEARDAHVWTKFRKLCVSASSAFLFFHSR